MIGLVVISPLPFMVYDKEMYFNSQVLQQRLGLCVISGGLICQWHCIKCSVRWFLTLGGRGVFEFLLEKRNLGHPEMGRFVKNCNDMELISMEKAMVLGRAHEPLTRYSTNWLALDKGNDPMATSYKTTEQHSRQLHQLYLDPERKSFGLTNVAAWFCLSFHPTESFLGLSNHLS